MHPDQSLWGVVSPRSMLVAPLQFADGKASTLLKMTLATEVLYTATMPVAPAPTPLPPLTLGSGSEEGGMTMNVPLRVSYSTMSRSMLEFAQRSSDLQEAGIKVDRVEFYPAGDRLVARVHAAVDVSGRLFDSNVVLHVAGRPVVDPNTHELTVAAFEIDRTIDNRLVDILETPMHGLFERAVQAQLRTDMTALIASANGHISEELKSLETHGVDVLTQITEVTVGETQFLEEVFVVPLQIRGELGVDVDLAKVAAL